MFCFDVDVLWCCMRCVIVSVMSCVGSSVEHFRSSSCYGCCAVQHFTKINVLLGFIKYSDTFADEAHVQAIPN